MSEQPPVGHPATDAPPRGARDGRPWRAEGVPGKTGDRPDGLHPRRWWAVWIIGYLVVFALLTAQDRSGGPPTIAYTQFVTQVQAHNVAEIYARGNGIQGRLAHARELPGSRPRVDYTDFATQRPTFADDDLFTELEASGTVVRAEPIDQQRGPLANILISFGPWLVILGVYWWLFNRQTRTSGGGLLGRTRSKRVDPSTVRTTFADVAGIDEVRGEVTEVVDFLQHPERYRRLGARAPRGVLLSGAPGTGKTLLARATAGEAGVPFFSASASEFIEAIVGVGASRVRQLFDEARAAAPAIVFIDEIDTIGRARGASQYVGGNDEREQTLNQVLTEMDGFSGVEGVIVMAATNRPDVLDPALLRPGRFDRTISVQLPDQRGRVQILEVHTREVPLAADVRLSEIAQATPGMSGADLANLVNEAALAAARRAETTVGQRDFEDALERVQLGVARVVVIDEDERRRTAYHEAGHALCGLLVPGADPVRKISIIPRGHALGVTLSTPDDDRYGYDSDYLRGRITGALGGLAAEQLVFGVATTGVDSDLETATRTARSMVGRWGMSERIGPVSVLPIEGDPHSTGTSDRLLAEVDGEVRRIAQDCYERAIRLLGDNRERLDALAAALLAHETLDQAEVYAAAGLPSLPTTSDHPQLQA